MTNKEALEKFKEHCERCRKGAFEIGATEIVCNECKVLTAKIEIKKSIPQEPYFVRSGSPHYECPHCSAWVIIDSPMFGDWKRCPHCGQAIKLPEGI